MLITLPLSLKISKRFAFAKNQLLLKYSTLLRNETFLANFHAFSVEKKLFKSVHSSNQETTCTNSKSNADKQNYEFKNKIAMVTGGASGIGLECAMALLWKGCGAVAIADNNVQKGEEALKMIANEFGNNKATFIKCDVTKPELVDWAFKNTLRTFNKLDIVVNSAAVLNDKSWENEIATNIHGSLVGTLLGLQYMNKCFCGCGGIVVNVVSTMGLEPFFGSPVHSMTQAAIIGLTRALGSGDCLKKSGVKVMTLCAGPTDTPMIQEVLTREPINDRFTIVLKKYLETQTLQSPCLVGCALLSAIESNESGAIWVIEDGEHPYKIKIPPYKDLNVGKRGQGKKKEKDKPGIPSSKLDTSTKESCDIKTNASRDKNNDETKLFDKENESESICEDPKPPDKKENKAQSSDPNKSPCVQMACGKAKELVDDKSSGINISNGTCVLDETCPKLIAPPCPCDDESKQKGGKKKQESCEESTKCVTMPRGKSTKSVEESAELHEKYCEDEPKNEMKDLEVLQEKKLLTSGLKDETNTSKKDETGLKVGHEDKTIYPVPKALTNNLEKTETPKVDARMRNDKQDKKTNESLKNTISKNEKAKGGIKQELCADLKEPQDSRKVSAASGQPGKVKSSDSDNSKKKSKENMEAISKQIGKREKRPRKNVKAKEKKPKEKDKNSNGDTNKEKTGIILKSTCPPYTIRQKIPVSLDEFEQKYYGLKKKNQTDGKNASSPSKSTQPSASTASSFKDCNDGCKKQMSTDTSSSNVDSDGKEKQLCKYGFKIRKGEGKSTVVQNDNRNLRVISCCQSGNCSIFIKSST